MVNDKIVIKTKITIFNRTKNRVELVTENLITDVGLALYADRLINNSVNFIDYFAIGDGAGTLTTASTALVNEIYRKQISNKSSPSNVASFVTTILGGEAIGSWTEIALFNASSSGVMTNAANVSYTHLIDEEIDVTWDITLSRP